MDAFLFLAAAMGIVGLVGFLHLCRNSGSAFYYTVLVICSILVLTSLAVYMRDELGTAISESSLSTGTAYVVLGEPVHDSEQYLVVVKQEDGETLPPRLYSFREPPPERFLVIRNERGEREYLPRPLPGKGK